MRKTAIFGAILGVFFALFAVVLDRFFPPPDPRALPVSATVSDRNGALLRAFTVPGGQWRLPARIADIDPLFIEMTVAYEDRRFRYHPGIDPLALVRAAYQLVTTGRIVSGGSTLSMQLARLLEPREDRSVAAKLRQMARAVQLEWRYSKDEILAWYLTLAPYGGNLEGVRAASLAYFGKEPRELSVAEAALLVALPQSPESRRPDRNNTQISDARSRVLARMKTAGVVTAPDAELAMAQAMPTARLNLPVFAAHASFEAKNSGETRLTIDRNMQEAAEKIALRHAKALGPQLSVAILIADHRSGEILARVGSAALFDEGRKGWIDMTRAIRSPGSTLKPFIYALAFDNGIAEARTLIEDRPEDFGGYRPKNFTEDFRGTVTLREALQLSLNIPAVKLLDAAGPLRLVSLFRNAGVSPHLPRDANPTLAIALGGLGVTLEELVTLYTALPRGGTPAQLREAMSLGGEAREQAPSNALFGPAASWQVADILSGTQPPDGMKERGIAYKTGTSYGYRDAWAVGFDGRLVIGVWVGRADGTAVPDLTGRKAAAPILFETFDAVAPVPTRLVAPKDFRVASAVPKPLQRFDRPSGPRKTVTAPPAIVFPPDGASVARGKSAAGDLRPVVLKLQGGTAPFNWLVDGRPVGAAARQRQIAWMPEGTGYSRLTVIDSEGRSATVGIYLAGME
ncbi:MAG: penicillin-binding protein 1C [Hyphomicrobiales bacterium]